MKLVIDRGLSLPVKFFLPQYKIYQVCWIWVDIDHDLHKFSEIEETDHFGLAARRIGSHSAIVNCVWELPWSKFSIDDLPGLEKYLYPGRHTKSRRTLSVETEEVVIENISRSGG